MIVPFYLLSIFTQLCFHGHKGGICETIIYTIKRPTVLSWYIVNISKSGLSLNDKKLCWKIIFSIFIVYFLDIAVTN